MHDAFCHVIVCTFANTMYSIEQIDSRAPKEIMLLLYNMGVLTFSLPYMTEISVVIRQWT